MSSDLLPAVAAFARVAHHASFTRAAAELDRRVRTDVEPALATLASAIDGIDERRDQPAGLLRLNRSGTAVDIVVMPLRADFLDAYRAVTVDLECDNALVDLVGGGFDAGTRSADRRTRRPGR